ncbi:LysE/ArgO family amino acid transporter [Candidatus Accumulibacter sp. ACC003]|uniref:LysE/ArgO family amino acid transporter n=1 Tax=Candidatus Accumulibacter sp. ACC003 TaxID=2823334 RepID=UPI0025BF577F|nr:LysE/ArgO family amino acid transporter [Candidatus Accumulibacter sp. ACC003]
MPADLVAGFLSGAVLIVAIGGQNSYLLRQGVRGEHILPLVLICASADALLIMAGVAGLGAAMQAQPALLGLARYGGAAFLLVYGLLSARRALKPEQLVLDAGSSLPLGLALVTCLGFTFLNPHVYLDTVILLGSMASQRGEGNWIFGAGAVGASFVWFFALGYGARFLAPLFAKPISWRILDSLISMTMFGLAGMLIME